MFSKTWRTAAGVEILIPPEYTTHEEYEVALRAEIERWQRAMAVEVERLALAEAESERLRAALEHMVEVFTGFERMGAGRPAIKQAREALKHHA